MNKLTLLSDKIRNQIVASDTERTRVLNCLASLQADAGWEILCEVLSKLRSDAIEKIKVEVGESRDEAILLLKLIDFTSSLPRDIIGEVEHIVKSDVKSDFGMIKN